MNKKETFLDIFDKEYAHRLMRDSNGAGEDRAPTFRKMFQYLIGLNKREYLIVETGCMRLDDNFKGDGWSTFLFDKFIQYYDGKVISVDIDKKAVELAKSHCSDKTEVFLGDSVQFLHRAYFRKEIDLLYLDSMDIQWNNPFPSAFHHMKEFTLMLDKLNPRTLVVIDDHKNDTCGKGILVKDFFDNIGILPCFKEYQIGWTLGGVEDYNNIMNQREGEID